MSMFGWWSPIPLIFQPLPLKLSTFLSLWISKALHLCLLDLSGFTQKCPITSVKWIANAVLFYLWNIMTSLPRRKYSCQKKKKKVGEACFVWEEHLASSWDDYETQRETKYRLYHTIPYSNIHTLSFDVKNVFFFVENAWSL